MPSQVPRSLVKYKYQVENLPLMFSVASRESEMVRRTGTIETPRCGEMYHPASCTRVYISPSQSSRERSRAGVPTTSPLCRDGTPSSPPPALPKGGWLDRYIRRHGPRQGVWLANGRASWGCFEHAKRALLLSLAERKPKAAPRIPAGSWGKEREMKGTSLFCGADSGDRKDAEG